MTKECMVRQFLQDREDLRQEFRGCVASSDCLMAGASYSDKHKAVFGDAFALLTQKTGSLAHSYLKADPGLAEQLVRRISNPNIGYSLACKVFDELLLCFHDKNMLKELRHALLACVDLSEEKNKIEQSVICELKEVLHLENVYKPWSLIALSRDCVLVSTRSGVFHLFEKAKHVFKFETNIGFPWLFRGENGEIWASDLANGKLIRFNGSFDVEETIELKEANGLTGCIYPFRAVFHEGKIYLNVRDKRNRVWRLGFVDPGSQDKRLTLVEDEVMGAPTSLVQAGGKLVALDSHPLFWHELGATRFKRKHVVIAPDASRDATNVREFVCIATSRFLIVLNAEGRMLSVQDVMHDCGVNVFIAAIDSVEDNLCALDLNNAKVYKYTY